MRNGIQLLLLVLVLFGKDLSGQTVSGRTAVRGQQETAGRFAVDFRKSGQGDQRIDVSFSSVVSRNSVNLTFETSEALLFMVNIIDADNKLMTRWQPVEKSKQYSPSIDISNLPSGSYRMDIFSEHYPAVSHTISFVKE
jgi:hypothetical protein